MDNMGVFVTFHVQSTVKTTHAKYQMEHVLHVRLDGSECTVDQVRKPIAQ